MGLEMVTTKIEKLRKGQKASLVDAGITSILSLLKATVGYVSGSIALVADALHDASDVLITIASWVGLKISERKPTKRFPYGFYKAENLASLFISFFFFYGAFEILSESIKKLFLVPKIDFPLIALSVPLISAISGYFISRYMKRIGREIGSRSLIAIGEEARIHIFLALSVFVGIFASYFHIPYVESLVGIFLSTLIFKVALETLKDSLFALMDVSPSKPIERKIIKAIKTTKNVKSLKEIKLRKSGPFIFGEAVIEVSEKLDLERAHKVSEIIERKIKRIEPRIESFLVHIEPYEPEKKIVAIPVEEANGIKSRISKHFGRANYFCLLVIEKGKIRSIKFLRNPFKEKEIRAGLAAAKFLIEKKITHLITKEIGMISFNTLKARFVKVLLAKGRNVKECVENFLKGKCREIKKPTKEKI